MTILAIHALASALAWLSGRCLLAVLRWPGLGSRGVLERMALSYVVGLCVVSSEAMGLSLLARPQAWHLVLLQLPLIGLAALARRRGERSLPETRARSARLTWWELGLVVLIASKLGYVLVMNMSLILRTHDAYLYWLQFAKSSWLAGDPIAREMLRDYPKLPAAMISYFATMAGRWDEFAVNLPYFNFLAALTALFHAALRRFVGRGLALAATYVLVSFPLVLNHAVLTGLADLPLAIFVLLCGSALHAYSSRGARDDLILACVFAFCMPVIKLDGWPYFAAAALAIAAAVLHRARGVRTRTLWAATWALVVAGLGLLLLLASLYPEGTPPFVPGPVWARIQPGLHLAEVAGPFFKHFINGYENWMLLGTLAALAALPLVIRTASGEGFALGIMVSLSLASYAYLFLIGGAFKFAVMGTTLNRSYMQILPLLIYAVLVMSRSSSAPEEPTQPAPAGELDGATAQSV